MKTMPALALAVVVLPLTAACGGASSGTTAAGTASPSTVAVSSSAPAPYVACRFPHGGLCLGTLGAGRHRSREFRPGLAYTVPRGWQNVEDLDANLELLPPNVPLPAVDAGRADFIGCTAT